MTSDVNFFQHGDEPDAARFALALGVATPTVGPEVGGFMVRGFGLTPDLSALTLDINEGSAVIYRQNYTTASPNIDPNETHYWTAHPIEKTSVTRFALTDNAINHVWLDADISTRNNPQTHVNTTGSPPTSESFKIGEIDTNETTASAATSQQWNLVTRDGTLTYPSQAAASEMAANGLPDGTAVYDRGQGVFHRVESSSLVSYIDTPEVATDAITRPKILADAVGPSELEMGSGLEANGTGGVRTAGSAIADTFLSEGASPHQIAVNISEGLTGDGSDNIRIDASTVAAAYLSAGANPWELQVNLGNGLEGDGSDSIRVNGGAIAGNALVEGANPYQVAVGTGAIQLNELDLSIAPTWTSTHTFNAGITGLPDPTNASDAANKSYVDAVEQSLDIKDSVDAATDGTSIDLTSTTDPNPIDGVTLSNGDRVLLKDQSTASENGLYEAVTATDPSTWVRTDDANEDSEVTSGLFVFVEEGTANQNRGFVLTTNDPITVGTSSLNFTQFSGAGQITSGSGLLKSGDTLSLDEAYGPTWTSQHTWDAAQVMAGVSTPSSPNSGYNQLYFKSDGNLYKQDDAGNEEQVGRGVGGTVVDLGTVTLEAGVDPAFDGRLSAISTTEDVRIDTVRIVPDTTGQAGTSYEFNYDWGRHWTPGGYEIRTGSVVQTADVSGQESTMNGMFFNSDGTKLFLIGNGSDNVYEYSLGTAYDISTLSFTQSFDVSGQTTTPNGIVFRDDGTQMYVIDSGGFVYEYALSTAYDVSTATFSQSLDVSGRDNSITGMAFNSDGTRMFITGQQTSSVLQFALSTAYDISTASFSYSLDVSSFETNPRGVTFNPAGTKMFLVGNDNVDAYEVHLRHPYDVASADLDSSFDVSTELTSVQGLAFDVDGGDFYGVGGATLAQYGLDQTAEIDLNLTVNWDTDPGSDITVRVEVVVN